MSKREHAQSLVDECLQLASETARALEGKTATQHQLGLADNGDLGEPVTTQDLDALLKHDERQLQQKAIKSLDIQNALRADVELRETFFDIVDQQLRELGFSTEEMESTARGFERFGKLNLALARQSEPIPVAKDSSDSCFVIKVSCCLLEGTNEVAHQELQFPGATTWHEFYRILQDASANWQVASKMGRPLGFSPHNGTWKYSLCEDGAAKDAGQKDLIPIADMAAFEAMKRQIMSRNANPRRLAILTHARPLPSAKMALHANSGIGWAHGIPRGRYQEGKGTARALTQC